MKIFNVSSFSSVCIVSDLVLRLGPLHYNQYERIFNDVPGNNLVLATIATTGIHLFHELLCHERGQRSGTADLDRTYVIHRGPLRTDFRVKLPAVALTPEPPVGIREVPRCFTIGHTVAHQIC